VDVLDAIRRRRSVRAYAPRAIGADTLRRLREALRSAPSACNFQPWRFIFVSDESLRGELSRLANGQTWVAGAPVIVVACGLPAKAYAKMGGHGNSVDVDVAIAVDHLTLAAVAEGLGTCWIGAFDEAGVKALLGVPAEAKVVAMTPVGYPESPGLIHPLDDARRKEEPEVFSEDRYGG
jgi:nitroreductase